MSRLFLLERRHCKLYFDEFLEMIKELDHHKTPQGTRNIIKALEQNIQQIDAAQKFAIKHSKRESALKKVALFFLELANASDSCLLHYKGFDSVRIDWALSLLRISENENSELRISLLLEAAKVLLSCNGNSDVLEAILAEAETICQEVGTDEDRRRLIWFRATIAFNQGDFESSLSLLDQVDQGRQTPEIAFTHAQALISHGQSGIGTVDKLIEAIEGYNTLGNFVGIVRSTVCLAQFYLDQERKDLALTTIEPILLLKANYDAMPFDVSCINIAMLLYKLDHREMHYYLVEAIEFCRVFGLTDREKYFISCVDEIVARETKTDCSQESI